MSKIFLVFFLFFISPIISLDNGVGLTPPMGWNSWNKFACNIDEELIKKTADALISSGLAAKGYQYINLDDCWQISRDSNNKIQEDKNKFPSGMKGLADYIHSKGLKFGLYSDAGFYTCQKRPGSLGFEDLDAESYAAWEVDYLKYDNCFNDGSSPKDRYPKMTAALNKTGRQIFFSMCEWGVENPATWAKDYGNSWRTTGDISDNWNSFVSILDQQVGLEKYAGPGHWNDPDMLEVGNGGMTQNEYIAHFSLWSLLKAPLLIGCDIVNIAQETLTLLSNEEVISVNQDKLGIQGSRIWKSGYLEVWAGPLEKNEVAAVLFNRGTEKSEITLDFQSAGFKDSVAKVRDLNEKKDLGIFTNEFKAEVESHSAIMVKLSRSNTFFA